MKKIWMICIVGLISIGSLIGEDINVVGTGAGMNVLQEIATDFNHRNPGTTIIVPPSIGSGGGVLSVGSEQECLGRIARNIKEKEEKYGLSFIRVANVPIVFYTNKNNKVQSLTHDQIINIYTGKITNWSKVGGANLAIEVVRREKGDSSLDVLEKTMPGFSSDLIRKDATTKYSDQECISFIEQTAGTVAFGTLGNGATADVEVISLDGLYPSDAGYPYTGFLALIYKKSNFPSGADAFVKFASSDNAHPAIIRAYAVPTD